MDFVVTDGWLNDPVVKLPSPNFNARPSVEISLLVIHNISLPPGQFATGQVQAFFCNQLQPKAHPYFATIADMQVSAHCLIERTGVVTQFVSFNDRAWHAGQSIFDGVANCNDFSIGIELEGTDDTPYTLDQYIALKHLTGVLMRAYPALTPERIVGHCHISPGRKTDPGEAFDWGYYLNSVKLLHP